MDNEYDVIGMKFGKFQVINDRILDRNLSRQEFSDKVKASARGEKVQWGTPSGKVAKTLDNKFTRWIKSWLESDLPITYKINADDALYPNGDSIPLDSLEAVTDRFFDTWENVGHSYVSFSYGGTTTAKEVDNDGINAVCWFDKGDLSETAHVNWVTSGIYRIIEVDIVFNSFSELPWDTVDPPRADKAGTYDPKDIQHVGTHEAGHLIGLFHQNSDAANTMYFNSGARRAIHFRTLEPGDAAGASYQYRKAYGTLSGNTDLKEYEWKSRNFHVKMVGDVTIPSGVTLDIRQGTTIEVSTTDSQSGGADNSKCELIVDYGKLRAEGFSGIQIVFKSAAGGTASNKWYGIVFKSNANDSSIVKYCDIKNAKYGVYVDNAAPDIYNNTITYSTVGIKTVGMGSGGEIKNNTLSNNTTGLSLNSGSVPDVHDNTSKDNANIGVYMDSSSPSSFYDNTIKDNDGEGVYLFSNASPTFGNNVITKSGLWGLRLWNNSDPILEGTGTTGRKNDIFNNGGSAKAEIYCQKNSEPKLGLSSNPGDNNIYDDAGGKVIFIDTGYSYGSINAEFNWWGTDPPDPAVLFSPSSEVDYVPYETELIPKPVALAREVSLQEERLIQALLAEENRQYDVAVGHYDQLLLESFEVEMVERAADGLFRAALHRGTDLSSVISRFEALASSHPSASVRRKVVALWRQALVADGQYNAAIAAYEQEMTEAEDFDDRLSAQKSLGEVYMYYMKDETRARQLLEPILRDYPNHPVAYGAWMVLLDVEDLPPPPAGREASQPIASASTASGASSDIGLETSPNPFNPSTTIRFQLPETVRVQLSIYNLLGQRVQELLPEELQPAGEYAVIWNGQDESGQLVASGMYIVQLNINERTYTLETNERTYTRKVMLMR